MNCASPLQVEAGAPREVRKTVTVVFTDVVGSTPLGERLDPEAMRAVMGRYFDRMRAVVERHGGTVEKFIGDAVMAVFGIPTLHEDDALRAVRAAAEMRDALSDLNRDLERERGVAIEMRTGVNTGEVMTGDPEGGQALVTGDAVNTAARLQQTAAPGDILLGVTTHRLLRDAVRVEPVEPRDLKGKASPVETFRLLELIHGVEAFPRHLDSPMVGRQRERELVRLAFERAIEDRTSQLVTVLGPAGVGKSRLVEEFLGGLGSDAEVLRGRSLPYGEGITVWPVREIVRQAAGIGEDEPADEARAKLRALCRGAERQDVIFERVANVLGLGEESGPPEETFWGVRSLLETMARRRPLVIVFEDLHWGEPTFLDLIDHLADWTRDAPMLLLCPGRLDLLESRPGWAGGKANATTIQLEPLSEELCEQLIANLLGQARLAEKARRRIVEAAEGNPLFVEQMLSMMIDDNLLRQDDGHWVPTTDLSRLSVPATIQALLAARLDRLAGEERAVIERASVVGRVFYRGAIAELSPEPVRPVVGAHLMTLVRRELIRPHASQFGDDTFRFRHMLIRDAVYQAMPKESRADLHERFAGWLEDHAGERLQEYEEILGYHLEQAHRYRAELGPVDAHGAGLARRATSLLGRAGLRAAARGDATGAVNLLTRASLLLPEEDPDRLRLLPDLAEALYENAEFARAGDLVDEVVPLARSAGDRPAELRARLVGLLRRIATDPDEPMDRSLAEANEILHEAERIGDEILLAHAQEEAAWFWLWTGRSAEAEKLLEDAIARAHVRGAPSGEVNRLYRALAATAVYGSLEPERGLRRWHEIAGEVTGVAEGLAHYVLGVLHAISGEFEHARSDIARADGILRELGATLYVAAGHPPMLVEQLAGNPAAVEARARAGIEALRTAGERGFLSTTAVYLAEALYAQGRDDEALEATRLSESNAASGDIASEMGWRTVRAKVLARLGQPAEAERVAREAVAIAERVDLLDDNGHAFLALAEVLRAAERPREASSAARRALEYYERRGNRVSAERAGQLIKELGE
jgi:class 3 adenylate cyclase/tetratricopeptide (TPR) repeat protein